METPTHAAVSQRARQIWLDQGSPAGRDTQIWLEAERQLTVGTREPVANPADHALGLIGGAGEAPVPEPHASTIPAESPGKTSRQTHAARDPQRPGKFAPKAAPPESGKPLWNQPHSS